MARLWCSAVAVLVVLWSGLARSAPLVLVEDGVARAVVVTAASPTPLASYAAAELVEHLRLATGVSLPVVAEDAAPAAGVRIYLGPVAAAAAAGIDAAALPPEGTRLLTTATALFIVGDDGDGAPMHADTRAGTLWGVYEVIERVLEVRWLWPGELGTVVPSRRTVAVPSYDETLSPRLMQRQVRPGLIVRPSPTRGFSAPAMAAYRHAQEVFLRRHRIGRSTPFRYGHAFEDWWGLYGEAHPEWFQMVAGRRGPTSPGRRFSMCVSDPGLHRHIIDLWRAGRAENPDGARNVNGCENDIAGLCECERCQAWDGPQPAEIPKRFGPRVVSDRYARFWQALHDLAVQEDPQAIVMGYAYVNYAPPPLTALRLHPNILVGTVPDLFFPRTAEEQQWVKDQWMGWRQTGCTLFLRPNYTLHGYVLPYIYVHQFADEFQFEAANGMRATDFDSLTGQWATQGPNNYVLMRLHTRPDQPLDEILAEYYSGFGPAASAVRRYFDTWEAHTTALLAAPGAVGAAGIGRWSTLAKDAHRLFPPSSFEAAAAILAEARRAAGADGVAVERVAFLEVGLEHARLCAQVAAVVAGDDAAASPFAAGRALRDLAAFREQHEGSFFSNLAFASTIEGRSWAMPAVWDGTPVQALSQSVAALGDPEPAFSLRGSGTILADLGKGEAFRARLRAQRIGANTSPVQWVVVGPGDRVLERGEVAVGEAVDLAVPVADAGTCALFVQSNLNRALVTARNDHAALLGPKVAWVSEAAPVFFMVPEGLKAFTLTLSATWPGENVRLRVLDPEGNEAATAEVASRGPQSLSVEVPPGRAGKAWSVAFEKPSQGVLEDYTIELGPELPPFLAHRADRLVQSGPRAGPP